MPFPDFLSSFLASLLANQLSGLSFTHLCSAPFRKQKYYRELTRLLREMPFIFRDISLTVEQDYVEMTHEKLDPVSLQPRRNQAIYEKDLGNRLKNNSHILFLGEPGVGKTTFQRRSLLTLIHNRNKATFLHPSESKVAVFVPLKAVDNSSDYPIFRFLIESVSLFSGRGGKNRLVRMAQEHQLFLFLDGYDEIAFTGGGRNHVKTELEMMFAPRIEKHHPLSAHAAPIEFYEGLHRCRSWLSSRKEFFRMKENRVLSIQKSPSLAPIKTNIVQISGVNANRHALIKKIFAKYRRLSKEYRGLLDEEYFLSELDRLADHQLLNMSNNPLFLTVMCFVYAKKTLESGSFNVTWTTGLIDLISTCIELLLRDLDEYKARDLPEMQREALRRRRNEYVEEKKDFLHYFAARLYLEEMTSFPMTYLSRKVKQYFQDTSQIYPQSDRILRELEREDFLNPNFAVQLLYCGIFVASATQKGEVQYDFPHRRFREVLTAQHLSKSEHYCDLLSKKNSPGISELMQVFKVTPHYSSPDLHRETLRCALTRSLENSSTNELVRITAGFFELLPDNIDVSDIVLEFLLLATSRPTPRFRVHIGLLNNCRHDRDFLDHVQKGLHNAVKKRDPSLAYLCLRITGHFAPTKAPQDWQRIQEECIESSELLPAWLGYGLDLNVQLTGELTDKVLSLTESSDPEIWKPFTMKWQQAKRLGGNWKKIVNGFSHTQRVQLCVRSWVDTRSEISELAEFIECPLNSMIIAFADACVSGQHEDPYQCCQDTDSFYIVPAGCLTWLNKRLSPGELMIQFDATMSGVHPRPAGAEMDQLLLDGGEVDGLRSGFAELFYNAGGQLLNWSEIEDLVLVPARQLLDEVLIKGSSNRRSYDSWKTPIVATMLYDEVYSTVLSGRFTVGDWNLLLQTLREEESSDYVWCEFFEEEVGMGNPIA